MTCPRPHSQSVAELVCEGWISTAPASMRPTLPTLQCSVEAPQAEGEACPWREGTAPFFSSSFAQGHGGFARTGSRQAARCNSGQRDETRQRKHYESISHIQPSSDICNEGQNPTAWGICTTEVS